MRIFLKICPLCLQTAPKCDKMILGYQNDHDLNTPNAATERVGGRTAAKREASPAERASARAQAEVRSRAAQANGEKTPTNPGRRAPLRRLRAAESCLCFRAETGWYRGVKLQRFVPFAWSLALSRGRGAFTLPRFDNTNTRRREHPCKQ